VDASDLVERATEPVTALAASGNPLELLPVRTRAVIVLRASQMPMFLVAAVLGISRQVAYDHLRRAKAMLAPIAPTDRTVRMMCAPLCRRCQSVPPERQRRYCRRCRLDLERRQQRVELRQPRAVAVVRVPLGHRPSTEA
jgi:uncharacterized paraquat-inducible protein A